MHCCHLSRQFTRRHYLLFFFFNDTATTEIYTLSLHDALPISIAISRTCRWIIGTRPTSIIRTRSITRSEEHTSELQSHLNLVCRLLLEKKKGSHSTQPAHPHVRCPST